MSESQQAELELVVCPDCRQVASIEWSRTVRGVTYLKIHCVARHWFLMPAEYLAYFLRT